MLHWFISFSLSVFFVYLLFHYQLTHLSRIKNWICLNMRYPLLLCFKLDLLASARTAHIDKIFPTAPFLRSMRMLPLRRLLTLKRSPSIKTKLLMRSGQTQSFLSPTFASRSVIWDVIRRRVAWKRHTYQWFCWHCIYVGFGTILFGFQYFVSRYFWLQIFLFSIDNWNNRFMHHYYFLFVLIFITSYHSFMQRSCLKLLLLIFLRFRRL